MMSSVGDNEDASSERERKHVGIVMWFPCVRHGEPAPSVRASGFRLHMSRSFVILIFMVIFVFYSLNRF